MKAYVGSKIILAEPMSEEEFKTKYRGAPVVSVEADGADVTTGITPGYHVRYPDGYDSWSPKEVFEESYRLVNRNEQNTVLRSK